jgi:RNA polymerase sigma-70 factor (ECF subfamily)
MRDAETDDELLRAAASDPEAFAVFYRRHADTVLTYLRYRTGDIEAAADLTADVFAAAFAGRRRYKPGVGPARAWLFGIANNLLATSRRRQRRAASARIRLGIGALAFEDEELERAEAQLSARLAGDLAGALLAGLPAQQREAVWARVVLEHDYAEIARDQDVSEAAVRQRVSRGLARVASQIRRDET